MTRLSDADLLRLEAHLEMTGSPDGFKPTLRKRHNNEESRSQQALIAWWNVACKNYKIPESNLVSFPNGGARSALTGFLMKKEGARKGVPDLVLLYKTERYGALFIEIKTSAGRLSEDQIKFHKNLTDFGYKVVVSRSSRDAIDEIKKYLTNPSG